MSTTDTAQAMNRKLAKFLPELDSPYGKYPLHYNRWLNPNERGPNGEPCFIAAPQDGGVMKQNYVWGKGAKGAGYYHLLTKAAYTNLYSKITHIPPAGHCCCACSAEARKEMDEWDDVRRIMYNRSVAPVPDDGVAHQAGIAAATESAQAFHHGMQNEQLFHMGVGRP